MHGSHRPEAQRQGAKAGQPWSVGVVGAGAIGRTHLDTIAATPGFTLAGIVDPSPAAQALAEQHGSRLFPTLDALLEATRPDGVIIATPNETHVDLTCRALAVGVAVLLEKPIANTLDEAAVILAAEATSSARVLVGHHRRHNPIIQAAKSLIDAGEIGDLVMAAVLCSLHKPDDYFTVPWRTRPGVGGPILINLIHEVDVLRFLFGDVAAVSAMRSAQTRGLPVEDTAGALLRFVGRGLASITLSDAAVGPWAWDIASGENLRFARSLQSAHHLSGTRGALSYPGLTLWRHQGPASWSTPLSGTAMAHGSGDAYVAQLRHFAAVMAGEQEPLVSALEAAKTLATVSAIAAAAHTGRETAVEPVPAITATPRGDV